MQAALYATRARSCTHTKCASTESVPALAEGGAIKLAKPNWLTDLPLSEKVEHMVACSARLVAPWCGRQAVNTVFQAH